MSEPTSKKPDLAALRVTLDEVDQRLLKALSDRNSAVFAVAELKAQGGDIIRDPTREEELLGELVARGKEVGLDAYFVTRLFREILDHSLRLQLEHIADHQNPERQSTSAIVVGYQGGEGAYSYLAARRYFGARDVDVTYRGFGTFKDLLEAVKNEHIAYAVLPIENTTAGSINESYDLLARMDLALVGEEIQKVDHCLIALEDVPLGNIRRIYSHPVALAQCSEFLTSLSNCHVEAFRDTALSVAKVKDEQDLSQAAIASEEAARLYGLPVLRRGLANQRQNYTRLVVVAREPALYDLRIPCKTSLVFALRHEEGALARCIEVLAAKKLNLTKLESRPRPNTPWEYLFYVDFEGNLADRRVPEALRELAQYTSFLKVLGSYPARTTKEAQPAEPKRKGRKGNNRISSAPPPPDARTRQALERKPYHLASRMNRSEDTQVPVARTTVGGSTAVVVAGPRAVASLEQIRKYARLVKASGAHILRAACFTPLTASQNVDGLGYEGVDFLAQAGHELDLPVMTEVVHPANVERVAEKVDVIQVGARNMQNFALLAEAGKVDRPVVLKRGLTARLDEWLTAAEYILSQGNQQVILCERGIRTFEDATPDTLDLSCLPILKERTHLPVLVDPGGAVGAARWVPPMAEAALAAGAHGLMIELHDPKADKDDTTPRNRALDPALFQMLIERLLF